MLCPHQREPPGVWYFHFRIPSWIHVMQYLFEPNLVGDWSFPCVVDVFWCGDQGSVEHVWTWAAFPRSWCTRRPCWARPCKTHASSAGSSTRQVRAQSTDPGGHEGGTSHRLALVNQRQASSVVTCCHSSDSTDSYSVCTQWNTIGRPWRRRWTTTLAHWTGATGWHWETRMSTMSMPMQSSLNHTKSR